MQLVHHPGYDLNLGTHVFPSTKFALVRERLLSEGVCSEDTIARPDPIADEDLLLVHEPDWVNGLSHGTLTMMQIVRLEVPYSQQMVRAFKLMCGGTLLAARLALRHGAAMNLGGGFHHAFSGHGEGFCALHDVAVAIRVLQREGVVRRVLIIDCDVHHGNGTAAIFADDPDVFTISLHQFDNYPTEKPPSNLDVHLPDGLDDPGYLHALQRTYGTAVAEWRPDMVFYVAGADPYQDDQLGGLRLTLNGLAERDRIVVEAARAAGAAVVATTAGGYARDLTDTVTIHAQTARRILAARN